jgi:hypothetical protein
MPRKPAEPTIETRRYALADGSVTTTWSVRYFDAGGRRRRVRCASAEEADFERARLVLEQSRNGGARPAVLDAERGPTLAEFWPPWIADARMRL